MWGCTAHPARLCPRVSEITSWRPRPRSGLLPPPRCAEPGSVRSCRAATPSGREASPREQHPNTARCAHKPSPPPSGAGAGQGDPSGPQATNPLGTGALTHLRLLNLKVPSVPCRGPDGCTSQAVRSPGCPQLLMSPEECGSPARPRTMPPFCPASWTGPEPSSASPPPSSELDTSPNKNAPGGFSA